MLTKCGYGFNTVSSNRSYSEWHPIQLWPLVLRFSSFQSFFPRAISLDVLVICSLLIGFGGFPPQGLQGLHAFLAQGLQAFFIFLPQGLQGLHAFLAQGLHAFFAQGLHAFFAQGLHAFLAPYASCDTAGSKIKTENIKKSGNAFLKLLIFSPSPFICRSCIKGFSGPPFLGGHFFRGSSRKKHSFS